MAPTLYLLMNFARSSYARILRYFNDPVARALEEDCVGYLKSQIHHEAFLTLYPTCNITPKMHYLIHYPDCIER